MLDKIKMGSTIEINDTLKIPKVRGFPKDLCIEDHVRNPKNSRNFLGQSFEFWNNGARHYLMPPARVFLVEEIDGRWLYWGNAHVLEQTIKGEKTSGVYRIIKIYRPDFQRVMTIEESPTGKSYFEEKPRSLM